MSAQPVSSTSSNNQYASGQQLTALGGGSTLQITGLASGLNTNSVIQALMSANQQQVTNLQNQQTGIAALNQQLTSIQTALQNVWTDAQALGKSTLWANTQTINSTSSALVGATATGSGGSLPGNYTVAVSQLATASQRTFSFASPGSADTITIDGHDTNLAAGANAQDLVSAINGDQNATVWATIVGPDPQNSANSLVVLSERNTGASAATSPQPPFNVSDSSGTTLNSTSTPDVWGTDAAYSINGGATQYSSSNTISGVPFAGPGQPTEGQGATQTIPGVTLNLNGVTGSTPVTVTVGAPGANQQNIQTAVQKFITDYNSTISQIQTQLAQTPSKSNPSQGVLYNDTDLTQLLAGMRQMMVSTVGGLTGSMSSMLNIGVSTGASTGSGAVSQSALSGQLTLDAGTLSSALATNPNGVKSMLQSWSIEFSSTVDAVSGPGGSIGGRIQDDNSQNSNLATKIKNLTESNALKQNQLIQQFAAMEAALSKNQSTSSWLTNQLNALP